MTNTTHAAAATMTFEEFAKAYRATFAKMMSYKLTEAGSGFYCDELAAMADAHPEWAEQIEAAHV